MRELELEILHSMIRYPQYIEEFLSYVPLKYFSKEARNIFEYIKPLADEKSLSIATLNASISETIKKSDYYTDLLVAQFAPNYLYKKDIFIRLYRLEKQKENANILQEAFNNGKLISLETLVDDTIEDTIEYKTLTDWMDIYENMPEQPKYKTGLNFLDNVFEGGFEVGQLILISGDPEAGKTVLGVQIIENIAHTHKVCFFSFEFQIQKYLKIVKNREVKTDNLFIINDGYDVDEVANNIHNLYKKEGVKVFFIDSQLRLTSSVGDTGENNETHKFSVLAKLCHSLDIIIILIVQTSKTDPNTPISTKRGGHEASIIIRLERIPIKNKGSNLYEIGNLSAEYETDRRIINIQKNKQTGYSGKELINFNTETLRFYDLNNNYADNTIDVEIDTEVFKSL